MSSQSRKQRRAYEKFLKKTNPEAYVEWKSESINRGKQIHQEHLDNIAMDVDKINQDSEIIDYDKI